MAFVTYEVYEAQPWAIKFALGFIGGTLLVVTFRAGKDLFLGMTSPVPPGNESLAGETKKET